MNKWVIMGSSGEYSDRMERVIGYCDSEDAAQFIVEKAESEKSLPYPVAYPDHVSTHSWFVNGVEVEFSSYSARPEGVRFIEKPDAAEIQVAYDIRKNAWRQGLIDADRIDIDGQCDTYYYELARHIEVGACNHAR